MSIGASGDIRAKVRECEQQLQRKDALVEAFKTQNSVLRNSLRYFPILASAIIDRARAQGSAELTRQVEALVVAIMLFDLAPDADSRLRVQHAQGELGATAEATENLHLARDIQLTLAHSKVIIERTPTTDRLVREALSVPLSANVSALEEAYSLQHRSAMERAHLRRQILLGLALLIIVLALADIILRLRSSGLALEEVTSQLRLANGELAVEREKERHIGQLKTRFVSMTSHEFRTPLSVIVSSSELLDSYGTRWSEERRSDHLARIRSAAASMWRMLDQLLLLGRAEAGVLRPAPADLDLSVFCRQLVESAEHASGRKQAIQYSFAGDPSVTLDERLLSEVVGNLLDNALKYSGAETLVYFNVVVTGEECEFTVVDHGIGIPEADLPRLFEHFYRASNADQIRGTGLGLAVVKASLALQHGTIAMDSQLGQGSRFVVRVPCVQPAAIAVIGT